MEKWSSIQIIPVGAELDVELVEEGGL